LQSSALPIVRCRPQPPFARKAPVHGPLQSRGSGRSTPASSDQAVAGLHAGSSSPVDERCLGAPHRVCAVLCWIKAQLLDPAPQESRVLACTEVRRFAANYRHRGAGRACSDQRLGRHGRLAAPAAAANIGALDQASGTRSYIAHLTVKTSAAILAAFALA